MNSLSPISSSQVLPTNGSVSLASRKFSHPFRTDWFSDRCEFLEPGECPVRPGGSDRRSRSRRKVSNDVIGISGLLEVQACLECVIEVLGLEVGYDAPAPTDRIGGSPQVADALPGQGLFAQHIQAGKDLVLSQIGLLALLVDLGTAGPLECLGCPDGQEVPERGLGASGAVDQIRFAQDQIPPKLSSDEVLAKDRGARG